MMPGMIMLWHGAIVDIPSGWALCNGQNGTPALEYRYVRGAGASLAPNSTGGSSTHTHDFTGDGHSHDLSAGTSLIDDTPAGDYFHGVGSSPATGETDTGSSNPEYRALCYIMKLPIP